jgi:hypothetical protein
VGGGHERVGQCEEGLPVGQGQRAWVEEFVLGLLVELLPAGHPGGVDLDDAVTDCLLHDADQDGDGVLHRGAAVLVGDPVLHGAVDDTIGDHPHREVAQGGDHTHPPPRQVGVQRFQLQAAQGEIHVRFAVFGELHGGQRRAQAGLCGLDDGLEPFLGLFFAVLSLGQ